jgi:hypothetical protein
VRAGVIGRLSRSSSLRIERPVPEMERLRSLRLNRRGVPSTPPDPSSQTEWGADPNALDACYEHINRARYLIPLIRDISGPAQTRPTHGCNKTRREYVSAAVMHDLGIEPRNSGVVRQKPDHDDRRVWRLKVTFHHNHRHAFVIRNIVARQLVQDAPPGPVMISARGCPLSSCQRACATKASAFSSSHRSRRTSAIACTRAASATADTLMSSSFALSSALASSVTDVFLLATAFIVLRSGFIPQRYTAIACGTRSTTRSTWTSATEVICGGAPGQRGDRRRLPTNGLGPHIGDTNRLIRLWKQRNTRKEKRLRRFLQAAWDTWRNAWTIRIPNQPVRHTRHHFPWCQCRLGLRAARPWIPPEVAGWLCFGNRAILSLRRFQKVAAEASKARCRAWRPRLRFGQCPYPGRPWAGDPSA